jgi:MFS family permease
MVPMRFFRSHAFASGIASSFFFYASMYGVLFFLPQFLQTAQGHGPFGAGLRLLPWTATLFVVAPVAGNLVNRVGERPLVVTGLILQAVGMAWIGLIVTPDLAYVQLAAPLILAGAGVSMAMPAAQNAVLSSVTASEIGKASGTFNMLRYLGGVFGIAVFVAVFAQTGDVRSPQAFTAGFASVMSAAAALSLVAAIAGLWVPSRGARAPANAEACGNTRETRSDPAVSRC